MSTDGSAATAAAKRAASARFVDDSTAAAAAAAEVGPCPGESSAEAEVEATLLKTLTDEAAVAMRALWRRRVAAIAAPAAPPVEGEGPGPSGPKMDAKPAPEAVLSCEIKSVEVGSVEGYQSLLRSGWGVQGKNVHGGDAMYRLVHATALCTLCSEGDIHTPAPAACALGASCFPSVLPSTCFPPPLHLASPPIPLLLLYTGGPALSQRTCAARPYASRASAWASQALATQPSSQSAISWTCG